MSQQVFDKFFPQGKDGSGGYIPGAIIGMQTRDGKDEAITGAGNMFLDTVSGLWVPVTEESPLPMKGEVTLTGQLPQPSEAIPVNVNGALPTGANTIGSVGITGPIATDFYRAGLETITARREGTMAAQTDEMLINIRGECSLEALTVSGNVSNFRLLVTPRLADGSLGTPLRIVGRDGEHTFTVQPGILDQIGGENDFFQNTLYDSDNDRYVIAMKRPALFGNGVRIDIGNQSSSPRMIAAACLIYRKRGEPLGLMD